MLIYQVNNKFYSFIIADKDIYKKTKEEFANDKNINLFFNKEDLTLQQIEDARKKVSEIVDKLNNNYKIDIKKELSDYFN